jgi:hypothetical protein
MLRLMIDDWALWLFLVGLAIGVAVTAVLLWRLPRREDDVPVEERRVEAGWIAATIEHNGGVAPESLVQEVLELHQAYLRAPRVPGPPPGAAVPPVRPSPPSGYAPPAGYAPPPPGSASPPPYQAPPGQSPGQGPG